MKRFVVLSYATAEALTQMSSKSKDEMQETMKRWFAWKEKYESQVIDMGAPLFGGVKVLQDGSTEISEKNVAGYMMIEAASMEDAIELLLDSPLFPYVEGCEIEVLEAQRM